MGGGRRAAEARALTRPAGAMCAQPRWELLPLLARGHSDCADQENLPSGSCHGEGAPRDIRTLQSRAATRWAQWVCSAGDCGTARHWASTPDGHRHRSAAAKRDAEALQACGETPCGMERFSRDHRISAGPSSAGAAMPSNQPMIRHQLRRARPTPDALPGLTFPALTHGLPYPTARQSPPPGPNPGDPIASGQAAWERPLVRPDDLCVPCTDSGSLYWREVSP